MIRRSGTYSVMLLLTSVLGLAAAAPAAALPIDFTQFHSPAEVDAIFAELEAAHPGLCDVVTLGTSIQGRPIKALKISDGVAADDPAEGDVVFLAAHHAREWISVEMALYLAEQILTRYATDPALKDDVDALEIWIVPVVNPDGFAHTWDPAGYRYWRKNRRNNGDATFGVDLNRNWGYEWGHADGSSAATLDDTYRGPFPFSEPELVAVRDFLAGLDNLKTLLSYHSFSELFLRPWGWTTADPPGEETLKLLAQRSIASIAAVHGHTYAETIWYNASGETTDYLWGESRTSAFTPELRPSSGGLSGFSPPPSTILPSNEENLPVALALIHDAGDREVWIRDHAGDTGQEPSAVWTGSGWSAPFWTSPDITTVPEALTEGSTVDLRVRVHNSAGSARTNVRVDVYYTDPRISLEFPNPDAVLIGSQTVTVPPAGTTVTFPWTVPVGTNSWGERHWCVGAIAYHATDMPLTTEARRTSNVAIRNFNTVQLVLDGGNLVLAATNYLDVDAELRLATLEPPAGWRVTLPQRPAGAQREAAGRKLAAIERKAALLGADGYLLRPGQTIYLPLRVQPPAGAAPGTAARIDVGAALLPLVAGERQAAGNGFTYEVVVPEPPCPCP